MTLWQEILWGWVVMTILPKLVVIPIWRWMWLAVKDTERQDEIDRAWLEGRGGGGGSDRHPRERRPWMPGPRRGPKGGGSIAARVVERRPRRVAASARRLRRPAPAR